MGLLRRWRDRRHQGWSSDREACEAGADGLGSATNWMQHVLDRDYPDHRVNRAVVVVEAGEGLDARVFYTTHSVDVTPVEIRGLLEEGLRGLDEIRLRAYRHADIERFVMEAMPALVMEAMPALVKGVEEAVYGKAQALVEGMRKTLQKEEEIEGYGRERLRDELQANGITPGHLRRLGDRASANPEASKAIHELAGELEEILAEPVVREGAPS